MYHACICHVCMCSLINQPLISLIPLSATYCRMILQSTDGYYSQKKKVQTATAYICIHFSFHFSPILEHAPSINWPGSALVVS
jgi:hypothetical protein